MAKEHYDADAHPPYNVPFLCQGLPFDSCSFWEFPLRVGWCMDGEIRIATPTDSPTTSPPGTPPGSPPGTPPGTPPGASPPGTPPGSPPAVSDAQFPGLSSLLSRQNDLNDLAYDETYQQYQRSLKSPATPEHLTQAGPLRRRLAIIQGWLFLAALNEIHGICNSSFSWQSCLAEDSPELLTTNCLNGLPELLIHNLGLMDVPTLADRLVRLHRCIFEVAAIGCGPESCNFREWKQASPSLAYAGCRVFISIRTLVRTLTPVFKHFGMWRTVDHVTECLALHEVRAEDGGTYQLAMELIEDVALCPSQNFVLRTMRGMDDDAVFLASSLGRIGPRKDHSRCTMSSCYAYNTSEELYDIKHVRPNCACKFVAVDDAKVVQVLQEEKIPLIRVVTKDSPDGVAIELEVVHSRSYVAISHVWSDGLGNPYGNALPACQILRLQRLTRATLEDPDRETPFWIDTLCVPVHPDLKAFRSKAIGMFVPTYREAHRVLVLEAAIQATSMRASLLEIALRIFGSVWFRRLWTLQEGVFGSERSAERLQFQLAEGTFTWKQCLELAAQAPGEKPVFTHTPRERTGLLNIARAFYTHEDLAYSVLATTKGRLAPGSDSLATQNPAETFLLLRQVLSNRMTSKVSDEPICIASLLGLDVRAIVRFSSTEDRMRQLYLLMERIPIHLLFNDVSLLSQPSIPHKGFRWAPLSLVDMGTTGLTSECLEMEPNPPSARCSPDGLVIAHPGFLLACRGPELGKRVKSLQTTSDARYRCELSVYVEDGEAHTFSYGPEDVRQRVPADSELALIGPPHLPALEFRALLVAIEQNRDDVLHAAPLVVGRFISSDKKAAKPAGGCDTAMPPAWTSARRLPSQQKWCIT